ncbi:MAG: nicotinate phosphoribosyltransferase [Treponema sp.]|nr:nicotinate phosphoribosyltransferase [Treponema sp.]
MKNSALFTDFYSLTMAQGYWKRGMNQRAVFEVIFRRQPFGGGFSIFAGLGTLVNELSSFAFSAEDLEYLKSLGLFEMDFLEYLRSFRFGGSLWAVDEGIVIFPQEPILRIDGSLIECQIIEGLVLNIINFQSLVATKTARVYLASGMGQLMEFGLRRAQGFDGALSASRAAYIGGAAGTSNVLAGKKFGIPVMGTMAHSWVMAFSGEEAAFQAYADLYPDNSVFLIDTYDTLRSGIVNAIKVGKRLAARGKNFGVRLDSGDIQYLSVEVRKALDEAGLPKATIAVSNDLDEYIIQALTDAKAPVNSWGVGTQMVTGRPEAAFTGVYKLAARENEDGILEASMKLSDNPEKTTNPGVKQVWRIRDHKNMFVADIMTLDDKEKNDLIEKGKDYTFWHPQTDYRHFSHTLAGNAEALLKKILEKGKALYPEPSLKTIKLRAVENLKSLDQSYKRILNPHIYKVSISTRLRSLKLELIKSFLGDLSSLTI